LAVVDCSVTLHIFVVEVKINDFSSCSRVINLKDCFVAVVAAFGAFSLCFWLPCKNFYFTTRLDGEVSCNKPTCLLQKEGYEDFSAFKVSMIRIRMDGD